MKKAREDSDGMQPLFCQSTGITGHEEDCIASLIFLAYTPPQSTQVCTFLDIIFVCNCLEQHSNNLSFYGWEANQVIVVTAGGQRKHQLSYSRSFGGR